MHIRFRVTALAALLLVTQQACGSSSTPEASGSPSSSSAVGGLGSAPSASSSGKPSSPSPAKTTKKSVPAASGGVLSGARQVYFFVLDDGEEVPESSLTVASSGRVEVNGDYSGRALFVPTPVSPGAATHLIKTGTLRAGGEALCLKVRSNGSNPLTVVTASCDAADKKQLFSIEKAGKDNQGRMTYTISNEGAFLQWNPTGTDGLIAEEIGDSKLSTTFVAIDRGKSTVPKLD